MMLQIASDECGALRVARAAAHVRALCFQAAS